MRLTLISTLNKIALSNVGGLPTNQLKHEWKKDWPFMSKRELSFLDCLQAGMSAFSAFGHNGNFLTEPTSLWMQFCVSQVTVTRTTLAVLGLQYDNLGL